MITNPGHTVELTLDDYTVTDTRMAALHIEVPDPNAPDSPIPVAALDLHGSNADAFHAHNTNGADRPATALSHVPLLNDLEDDFVSTYGAEMHVALYSTPNTPWHRLELSGKAPVAKLNIHNYDWGPLLNGETITAVMAN